MLDYKRAKASSSPRLSNQQPIPKSGFLSGLPNSALLPTAAPADSGLDEKMRLRLSALLGQNPAAEAEADRLSQGVQASTPEGVKAEMGRRLDADLSGVRLHTGGEGAERADHMGANAFTVGRDVYFGSGGFRADTAAHEMVHAVQQGAVEGGASVFVPMGSVQMEPKFDEDMSNFKVWAKEYKFMKLSKKINDLNKWVNEHHDSDKSWDMLRGNIMNKIHEYLHDAGSDEYLHDAGSEDPWVNELENVLQQLQVASGPTIINKNMENYQKWVNENMSGKEEEFDKDDFFMENDPVFASVSNVKGEDAVGSIYFGGDQGLQGGRLRLIHKSGPEIALHDHVFRYSLSAPGNEPKPPVNRLKLMNQLHDLWPELLEQPEHRELLKGLAKNGVKILKQAEYKEALQAKLKTLEPNKQSELQDTLNTLGETIPEEDALIDYTALNNHTVFEYLYNSGEKTMGRHPSRGHAKAVGAVTRLSEAAKEDLIYAVRYAVKLNPDKNADAAKHANNFLNAFMSEHNELKNIPLNKAALVPIPNYYNKKKEENSSPSIISRIFHWLFS